ncbi:GGDEF domain-containing protein [Desulfoplanes formicivorans]|nr:GGDEF domain-containing protein [Desulfoplanes formicivorans]
MNQSLDKIFNDLETLSQRIKACDSSRVAHCTSEEILALVRIIRGMTPEQWQQLGGEERFPEWFAVPMGHDNSSSLQHIQDQLDRLAFQKNHDPLTQLPNRHVFDVTLQRELERAYRFKHPVSLCIIDLDDFKKINDTYGHPCGDHVLRKVADILTRVLRQTDIPSRIGGEEFAIILPGTGLVRSQRLLSRLQVDFRALRIPCSDDEAPVRITCSMGLATSRGRERILPDKLYAAADQALYKAKKQGKDTIETAPLMDLAPVRQDTLVLQEEKHFLFAKK